MLKSSGAMGAATLTSRLLGMVREMVYARFMGDGAVASAWVLAFMIPNLFRRLLGEGALTAAFIPLFKEKEQTSGEREMWGAANAVITALVWLTIGLSALVVGGISLALFLGHFELKTLLMLRLLRWTFPYLILVCLAAVFMGILNARGHFFVPAMGASMLNLVMIATVLLVAPLFGTTLKTQIFALAIGVLVAGVAQAGFQVPLLRREGLRYRWTNPWPDPTVRLVAVRMIPGIIGVAAFQINVLLTQGIAFMLDKNIVASFNYAVRLMELPQGVFGASLATFLLPTLSGMAAEKKYGDFRTTLRQGIGYLVFANLIASVLLIILAEPILRLLFQGGRFDPSSTRRAALALSCLAPGLVAYSLVNILARAFYALGDTETPMRISVACLAFNLVFALWLVVPFRQGGLGLANTLSSSLNVGLLVYALRRKLKRVDLAPLKPDLWAMGAAAVIAVAAAWSLRELCNRSFGHAHLPGRLAEVFLPLGFSCALYWAVCLWLKVPAAREIWQLLRRYRR